MTSLPASIETYLLEAGFSATEILVLKRLIEGEAMTLRELAAKTGKSTGVLDQAMKKLIEKRIIAKENINGTSKYVLSSLDAVKQWIEKDVEQKKEALHRKKKDFDAFISTVEHTKGRPEMQYFDGVDGLEQAFAKLIEKDEKEWLHFVPAIMREEDDPLCEKRVSMFRERRSRKVFMRSISQDVPLGRRYQSRDAFEYRDTRLIPVQDFPVSFEEFIVGDTVACFDIPNLKASFIQYPELADSQRHVFEMLWCKAGEEDMEDCNIAAQNSQPQEPDIETRVLSGLREFFMSKGSLISFMVLAVLSGVLTWGMHQYNLEFSKTKFAEKATAIASTASLQVDGDALDSIREESDMHSTAYQDVFDTLNTVRKQNGDVAYIYIVRPNDDLTQFKWIVDADSHPSLPKYIDNNADGILNEADAAVIAGELYDVSDFPEFQSKKFTEPIATREFITDQWGTFITGYAPVFNSAGDVAGLLGVDYWSSDVQEVTIGTFSPIYYALALFIAFVFIRFAAFHRSLAREMMKLSQTKRALIAVGICCVTALIITFGMYKYTLLLIKEEIGERLISIVATAAPEINYKDVQAIHWAKDMYKPEYQRLFTRVNEIRDSNTDILYVYIMRPADNPTMFEFVADADSNYFLPIDPEDPDVIEVISPGTNYAKNQLAHYSDQKDLLKTPIADTAFTTDKWGTYLSASAPILNENGIGIAILGVDMDVSDVYKGVNSRFKPYLWFFSILAFSFVLYISVTRKWYSKIGIEKNCKK